ncbi:MAG TPA: hypothetical protein VKW04_14115 [Planctomycetota bacterium]|nr:hypothetical protein [Planctomycetota bacterium]
MAHEVHPNPGDSAERPSRFLEDLEELLSGDQALYLCLEESGAVFSVKSEEGMAFGTAIQGRWRGLTPSLRARTVVQWIEEAARQCRRPEVPWAPPVDDKLG